MLNTIVSNGNVIAGRMIAGVIAMSLDHPFVLTLLMGSTVAVLLDLVSPKGGTASAEQPIRLLRP